MTILLKVAHIPSAERIPSSLKDHYFDSLKQIANHPDVPLDEEIILSRVAVTSKANKDHGILDSFQTFIKGTDGGYSYGRPFRHEF